MKENSINNLEMAIKYSNNREQKKPKILDRNMATKTHNEKVQWINNITRELERLKEGSKAKVHTDLPKTTLRKISNVKTTGHKGIHGFWFGKFTLINDKLAPEMNKCL